MNNSRYISQLIIDIQASKEASHHIFAGYVDELLVQIMNFNLEVKTTDEFILEEKKMLSELTGISKNKLPGPEKLSDSQKELLSIELLDLLHHYHLYPDFPWQYPNYLKYEFIREMWNNSYPVIHSGICYITFCSREIRSCPFTGYCNICHKQQLKKPSMNDNYIPSIFNYCDRWCERCAFTDRCLSYNMDLSIEREIGSEKPEDLSLQKSIVNDSDPVPEVAGYRDEMPTETEHLEVDCQELVTDNSSLTRNAQLYGFRAHNWLSHHEKYFESKQMLWEIRGCLEKNREALSVLRWYCLFIYTKIARAWSGYGKEYMIDTDDQEEVEAENFDMNGSAKVALIAMDRSLMAWHEIRQWLPEFDKRIHCFMNMLNDLRKETEDTFPDARSFIRPGLDE